VPKPAFWNNTKRYYDLKSYWVNRFGCRVHKLRSMPASPARTGDGSIAAGDAPTVTGADRRSVRWGTPSVGEQIRRGKAYYRKRPKAEKFIAYFQTFTNTYGPVERLQALYDEALAEADVIGLAIGTRPDCLSEEALALIRSYAERYHVWLEFGLQSIHDRTLRVINRGHDAAAFIHAVRRAGGGSIQICVHIIVVCRTNRMRTFWKRRGLSPAPHRGIKIHCLLALREHPSANHTAGER